MCMQFYWGELHVRNLYIIGASLSEPHIDEKNGRNLHIYIYIWYIRHPRAADINVQQYAIISRGRIGKFGDFSSGHASMPRVPASLAGHTL